MSRSTLVERIALLESREDSKRILQLALDGDTDALRDLKRMELRGRPVLLPHILGQVRRHSDLPDEWFTTGDYIQNSADIDNEAVHTSIRVQWNQDGSVTLSGGDQNTIRRTVGQGGQATLRDAIADVIPTIKDMPLAWTVRRSWPSEARGEKGRKFHSLQKAVQYVKRISSDLVLHTGLIDLAGGEAWQIFIATNPPYRTRRASKPFTITKTYGLSNAHVSQDEYATAQRGLK